MDENTFLRLIEAHQNILHRICRIYRQHAQDRRDLFQEIVFQLWKSVPGFRGEAEFSTWMYRVALSTAIAEFRKPKPPIRYMARLPDHSELPMQPDSLEESRERLFQAIGALKPAEKALITLYLEELSYREIAQITGISENNVGVKLNRIRSKIEKHLK